MRLIELKGLKHPHILVRFLDNALGLMEKPYTNPVKIRIPRVKQDDEYRKISLFKITYTGQGLCIENKLVQNKKRVTI